MRWPSVRSAAPAAGVAISADAAITQARHSRVRRVPLISDDLRRFDIVACIVAGECRETGHCATGEGKRVADEGDLTDREESRAPAALPSYGTSAGRPISPVRYGG
ncbi:hypothetical protein GCM10023100_08940 [Actinocorallia cavernae]|uniref:Uncharacterized protein n=2 Tax=Actinomycetes TaxID=1760 RepID=A0ABP5Z003_9ACTN